MRRREFITLLGGVAAVTSMSWPILSPAQRRGESACWNKGTPMILLCRPAQRRSARSAQLPRHLEALPRCRIAPSSAAVLPTALCATVSELG